MADVLQRVQNDFAEFSQNFQEAAGKLWADATSNPVQKELKEKKVPTVDKEGKELDFSKDDPMLRIKPADGGDPGHTPQFRKLEPKTPYYFDKADTDKDGQLTRLEVDNRLSTMPHLKCEDPERRAMQALQNNFDTIAGKDDLISVPEAIAVQKTLGMPRHGCKIVKS